MLTVEKAEAAIQSIDESEVKPYQIYWESVKPKNDEEHYWRFVFAHLSVHTSWNSNVNSYLHLRKTKDQWFGKDKQELTNALVESRVGLYVRRSQGISLFTESFKLDPNAWKKVAGESWIECRNRLAKKSLGIGLAKTAFALEMCYPNECDSVCLDTHMLQLYGYEPTKQSKITNKAGYLPIEKHWTETCKEKKIPSYIARCIFWDKKQHQKDSRYWSHVFESNT